MVKKTYIKPNMVVKNVATQSMIAESMGLSSAPSDMLDEGDILVKEDRGGFWDDEW